MGPPPLPPSSRSPRPRPQEATVKSIGPLPLLPRMRVTATLRELRALMQAGVQEAALFTAYMVKGGIHELEKRLHVSSAVCVVLCVSQG